MPSTPNTRRPAGANRRYGRRSAPLPELEQPCPNCSHQNAMHTGGASRSGWALYDPAWADATGWCNQPGCDCQSRARTGNQAVA